MYIVYGVDTFVVLPSVFGKKEIFSHLPAIYKLIDGVIGTILFISFIKSLVSDQGP